MNIVTLRKYDTIGDAYNDKNLLEDNGINAEIQGEYSAGIYPGLTAIAPIQLLVAEDDEQKAKEILGIE